MILTNVLKIDLGGHLKALRLCFGMTIVFVVLVYENIRPRIKRKALRDKREAEEALEAWKKSTSRSRKKSVTRRTHEDFQPHGERRDPPPKEQTRATTCPVRNPDFQPTPPQTLPFRRVDGNHSK